MQLVNFLNKLFKHDGFVLEDYMSNEYVIGKPIKEKPIKIKLLNKNLGYKLLYSPDLYFGEAYTDGSLRIENGTLTDFLEIAFQNIGRREKKMFSYSTNCYEMANKRMVLYPRILRHVCALSLTCRTE